MISKKSLILVVLCMVVSVNSVVAVDAPQKQEQRFSPETVAKIKKVALATGLSVAAVATIALTYRYGVKDGITIACDFIPKQIVDSVGNGAGIPVGSLAVTSMTQDTNGSKSPKDLVWEKIAKWLNEHGVIVNAVEIGAGLVGGSTFKAAKVAKAAYASGFGAGIREVLMKLPKSFGPNSTSGSARALWNAFGKYL